MAGLCFIAPAVVIVGLLAWLYQRYGTDPAVVDLPFTTLFNVVVGSAVLAGYLAGAPELLLLLVAGAVAGLWANRGRLRPPPVSRIVIPLIAAPSATPVPVSLWRLLLVFLEIGSVLYGSGYVLLAFLQRRLVDDLGWLTAQQLLDAVAIGQVTPGPLFSTATFVGWQIDGPAGAAVATVGIFAPSFVLVDFLDRIVAWMRPRPTAKAFLTGVTCASLGLMVGVLIELTATAITDIATFAIAVAALGVLITSRVNSAWLIAVGAGIGALHAGIS